MNPHLLNLDTLLVDQAEPVQVWNDSVSVMIRGLGRMRDRLPNVTTADGVPIFKEFQNGDRLVASLNSALTSSRPSIVLASPTGVLAFTGESMDRAREDIRHAISADIDDAVRKGPRSAIPREVLIQVRRGAGRSR